MKSTTIGIDLAKSVFQISVADAHRYIIKRRRLSRSQCRHFLVHTPPAKLVMEGCASAHRWGRLALVHGHEVKLLHAGYVRAYVRRNKTDAADADALARADADPVGRRLLTISGVRPVIAGAMLGSVSDIQAFKRGRAFASWPGLTPRAYSSGSSRNLGRISSGLSICRLGPGTTKRPWLWPTRWPASPGPYGPKTRHSMAIMQPAITDKPLTLRRISAMNQSDKPYPPQSR